MKINRHGITLSLISFLIAGAPAFAQDGSSWASPAQPLHQRLAPRQWGHGRMPGRQGQLLALHRMRMRRFPHPWGCQLT
ncbi:hypothetical protein ERU95_004738 [Escherichia coli]|nr:hypothetical protein [Escherichia coli]